MEKNNIILIRSPPYTGKTSLATLLKMHFEQNKQLENGTVVLLTFLGVNSKETYPDFNTFWKKKTGASWDYWLNRIEPTTIILDETQMIYGLNEATPFWQQLKLMCEENEKVKYQHTRVIVFAAYGDRPGTGTQFATPFTFPASYGSALLFCTESEGLELVEDFNKKNETKINISKRLADELLHFTAGHFGLLARTLFLIENKFKNRGKYDKINDSTIAEYLLSADFFSLMSRFRGAPELDNLTPLEVNELDYLLLYDTKRLLNQKETRQAIFSLMKKGILRYVDKGPEEKYATSEVEVGFISPLIRHICFCTHYSSCRPREGPNKLEDFILQCLQLLKPSLLQKSLGRSAEDAKGESRLMERTWQMEIYRIATSLLPPNSHISPDVGHNFGTDGLVDFYVNDNKKWIIEIIREGDRLKEHQDRFKVGGIYSMIEANEIVVIDFRHESKNVRSPKDRFWYVKYNDNFTAATIQRGDDHKKIEFLGDSVQDDHHSIPPRATNIDIGGTPRGECKECPLSDCPKYTSIDGTTCSVCSHMAARHVNMNKIE